MTKHEALKLFEEQSTNGVLEEMIYLKVAFLLDKEEEKEKFNQFLLENDQIAMEGLLAIMKEYPNQIFHTNRRIDALAKISDAIPATIWKFYILPLSQANAYDEFEGASKVDIATMGFEYGM